MSGRRGAPPSSPIIGLANHAPFAFAGLWERWRDRVADETIESYTNITTQPNDLCAPIHNRMPAILDPSDYDAWLEAPTPPAELLRPFPGRADAGHAGQHAGQQAQERRRTMHLTDGGSMNGAFCKTTLNDLHFRVELWDDREIHLVEIIAAASDATTARAAYGAASATGRMCWRDRASRMDDPGTAAPPPRCLIGRRGN
jgi:hypothetical protein